MSKGNLLFIADISKSSIGGPSYTVVEYAHNLSKLGFNVCILQSNFKKKIFSINLTVFNYFDLFKVIIKLFISRNNYIVEFNSFWLLGHAVLSYIIKYLCKSYYICPRGGTNKNSFKSTNHIRKKLFYKVLFKRFFSNARYIHYLSLQEKNNCFINKSNYFISPNGVDLFKQKPNSISSDKLELLFVSRLDYYRKGVDRLLEFYKLLQSKINYQLNIVGNGNPDQIKLITNHSNKIFASKVNFVSNVSQSNILNYYRKSNIFVFFSRNEGLPMVVLEALSHGLPCLLSIESNLSEVVVKYKAGFCIKSDSDFLEAIHYLSNKKHYEAYSYNALMICKKYFYWPDIVMNSQKYYM